MNMAQGRQAPRIAVAQPVIQQIETLRADQAAAVEACIRTIGITPGEPVDLPTARPGTPYQAQRPTLPEAPLLIYRQAQPGEPGDWLVVSLMTPGEYRQQKADEQSGALRDPAIREEIRVAAGTAATTAVAHPPTVIITPGDGAAASPSGAVPTSDPGAARP
jgi:hypothetical protein